MRKLIPALAAALAVAGQAQALEFKEAGSVRIGEGEGYAEIAKYQPATKMIVITSSATGSISRVDLSDPSKPVLGTAISLNGGDITAVAAKGDLVAASIKGDKADAPGKIMLFGKDGVKVGEYPTSPLPDNIAFSPDGRFIITANEGEPAKDYSVDPEGGFTIVDLADGPEKAKVTQVSLKGLALPTGARIVKPGSDFAADAEPEYVAVDASSRIAYATVQENNALATIDLAEGRVISLTGFGFRNALGEMHDMSDKDGATSLRSWPVTFMYQPDAIVSYQAGGQTYLVTANEGDAKDYDGFSEETRVAKLKLDATAFPNAAELQKPENLGRLKTTTTMGDTDGDGDHDRIFAYGGRSFSIWSSDGEQVFDSGDIFETVIAERSPEMFNADEKAADADSRSDDKGPEPEALAVGEIDGRQYAFIGMERNNAIFAFDVTNPSAPVMAGYLMPDSGHVSPEGLEFVAAADSPNGKPLLIGAFEVSGTIAVWELTK